MSLVVRPLNIGRFGGETREQGREMVWLLISFWAVAMVLAFWGRASWYFLERRVLSIVLIEAALLAYCRLHDGAWPVAALGAGAGAIYYAWHRERERTAREHPAPHGDQ